MTKIAMMDGGMMAAMGIGAFVLLAAVLAALVAAVLRSVWLVRTLRAEGRHSDPTRHGADPSDVLRSRYASGEIDEDEYHRRLSTLGQQ